MVGFFRDILRHETCVSRVPQVSPFLRDLGVSKPCHPGSAITGAFLVCSYPLAHASGSAPLPRQAPDSLLFPSTRSFHGDNSLARGVPLAITNVLIYNYKVNIRRGPRALRLSCLGVPATGRQGTRPRVSQPLASPGKPEPAALCQVRLSGAGPGVQSKATASAIPSAPRRA
jgi:hypothetical protein